MRTIGAKLDDKEYEECETVIGELGFSRSDYVRTALRMYNYVHHYRKSTEKDYPVPEGGEPDAEEGKGTSEYQKTCPAYRTPGRMVPAADLGDPEEVRQ